MVKPLISHPGAFSPDFPLWQPLQYEAAGVVVIVEPVSILPAWWPDMVDISVTQSISLLYCTYIVDHVVAGPHPPCIEAVRQGPRHPPASLAHSENFRRVVIMPALSRASSNNQNLKRKGDLR